MYTFTKFKLEQIKRIVLHKIQYAIGMQVNPYVFRDMEIDVYTDHISGYLTMQLHTAIFQEKEVKSDITYYEHPKTWLDAFRIRFFPKLLIKKYPIQKIKIERSANFTILRTCPHLDSPNKNHDHVAFMITPQYESLDKTGRLKNDI